MTTTSADVLRLIEDGGKSQAIADLTGLPRGEVVRVARENGWGLNVSNDRFQRTAPPKPKPVGVVLATGGVVEPVTLPNDSGIEHVVPLRPVERDLIAEGKASSVARVRNAAVRAEGSLQHLADLLDETRAAEEAKATAEREKAEARAEVARLEKKLRDARERLKGGRKDDGPSLDAKTVRAWAAEQGVDCPPVGRVPRVVMDAYREAVAS